MALFETKKLPVSALVEQVREWLDRLRPLRHKQACATGMNAEGKTPKTLVEEMVPLLDDRSVRSVNSSHRGWGW